jgi:SecD/SecF fusion protein
MFMQWKTLFKTVFIIFVVLWSLYALYPTYKIGTMAPEVREKLDQEGKLAALNEKKIRMGLDLQGGMYLTMEVDLPALVKELARNKDTKLDEILQKSSEELNVSSEEFLTILKRHMDEQNLTLDRYWGKRGDSEKIVLSELEKEAKGAMSRSLTILRNRIDQYGVSEPIIQPQGNRRIVIQLPGIVDPDRAKRVIQNTAILEFKMLKDPLVYSETIQKIDAFLAGEIKGTPQEQKIVEADTTKEKQEQKPSKDKVVSVSELFGESETPSLDGMETDTSVVVDEQTYREKPFLSLLRDMRQHRHEVSVQLENVRTVTRILERPEVQRFIPNDAEFLWGKEIFDVGNNSFRELYLVKKDAEITGKYLTDARVNVGSDIRSAGRPEVHFELNRAGARIFKRVTGANVGKRMAIVLDSKVASAPTIQEEIGIGSSPRITGMTDMDDANDVALILRIGRLPAPIQIIQEYNVGPSLGKDSIRMGTLSSILGLSVVILFMIFYYKFAGFVADIALIMNLVVLLAVLAQFGFVLTLPGVAGIVLTIGMAVDANVLVFERIREELLTGKTVRASIETGYSRAFKTILVLYQFGTGPIRGFAVTLSIGIIVSMFTALVVTRRIFDALTARRTLRRLSI